MHAIVAPELSRITKLSDVPDEGITLHVEASAEEREALARRFGAMAIESLAAEVTLHPKQKRTCWQLDGHVLAEVVQSCVVTLSPVLVNSKFDFKRQYAAVLSGATMPDSHEGDEVLTLDQDDPPEPLLGDVIDVGEAIAEEFGLALDPFPRAAGVTFDGYSVGPGAPEGTVNAFAILTERRSNENEEKG